MRINFFYEQLGWLFCGLIFRLGGQSAIHFYGFPQEISIWITHPQKFCRCSNRLKELCANDFDSLHHAIGEPVVVPCPDPERVPVSKIKEDGSI